VTFVRLYLRSLLPARRLAREGPLAEQGHLPSRVSDGNCDRVDQSVLVRNYIDILGHLIRSAEHRDAVALFDPFDYQGGHGEDAATA
jgi:hypothetical protein